MFKGNLWDLSPSTLQDVSNISNLQRNWRKHGPAQDVPQPALLQDVLQGRSACRVSDRRYLLCSSRTRTFLLIYVTPTKAVLMFIFILQGVGTVVSGTTLRGLIRLNDTMLLGPDPLGSFIPIAVKSIHRKRMPVKEVRGGQTASFALKKVEKTKRSLTKGKYSSAFTG